MKDSSRLEEIQSRSEHVNKIATDLKDAESLRKSGTITEDQYQDIVEKIGNQSAFDMGINAASSGQIDNLLHSISDPAFKNMLMKNMTAEEQATFTNDKYESIVANLSENILQAESIYKAINNKMGTADKDVPLDNYILNKGIRNSYDILQREKENKRLDQEFEQELGDSKFFADSSNPDFRNAIELQALTELQKTYSNVINSNQDKEGYVEFLNNRLAQIKDRKEVLKSLVSKEAPLTSDHDKLVALKYKQLGNEFQITTNKEVNNDLFSAKKREQAKAEFEKAVTQLRKQKKEGYESVMKQAEEAETLPELTVEELQEFGDKRLVTRYNKLVKKLEENKLKEQQLQTTVVEQQQTQQPVDQIEENDDTISTVSPVTNLPGVINREQGLEKVTPQQKARFLKLIDDNYASKKVDQLERYKEAALDRGLVESDGFIQDINNKIAELTNPLPVNKEEVVESLVVEEPIVEDTPIEIEEEVLATEEVAVQDVTIENDPTLILPAEEVKPEIIETPIEEVTGDENTVSLDNVTVFIPGIHDISNITVKRKGSKFEVLPDTAEVVKAIKSIRVDRSYEIKIDAKNPFHKNTKEDAAIAVYVDGKPIMYINTESTLKKQLAKAKQENNTIDILKHTNALASISAIRDKIWNNPNKVYTTQVKRITSGTIIPGESSNPLDVIAGSWRLAYVDPQNPNLNQLVVAGETEIYYGSNKETQYNADAKYTPGVEYLLLEGYNFDGSVQSRTPVRIHRNNLSENAASDILVYIEDIVQRMRTGEQLNSEAIEDLKSRIGEITPVNKYNQDKSELNGQVYYTIPKPYFKIHSNRIEFLFDNNTKLATIWFKDKKHGNTKLVVEEWKTDKASFANDKEYLAAKGKPLASYGSESVNFRKGILTALQKRAFNVTYPKSGLSIEAATSLLSTGRLRADFGTLADKSGNLSNFWGKPEKSLVDGIERYQKGNLVIEIGSNLKEQKQLVKGLKAQLEEGLLENIGEPLTEENLTKLLKTSVPNSFASLLELYSLLIAH